ncbi:MAG: TonB family protein [Sulfurimonas sp.]|nr:TonB family protein [Sulfurimonas sp.]
MSKLWFFILLLSVTIAHLGAFMSIKTNSKAAFIKPDLKITKITLSSVVLKKDPPAPKIVPKPAPKIVPKPIPKLKKLAPLQELVLEPIPIKQETQDQETKQVPPKPTLAPKSVVDTSSVLDRYTSSVRALISQNLHYPSRAKRYRIQGVVDVSFTILKDGTITAIIVDKKSKNLLKKGALKTLRSLSFKPIPSELKQDTLEISIPIKFSIIGD